MLKGVLVFVKFSCQWDLKDERSSAWELHNKWVMLKNSQNFGLILTYKRKCIFFLFLFVCLWQWSIKRFRRKGRQIYENYQHHELKYLAVNLLTLQAKKNFIWVRASPKTRESSLNNFFVEINILPHVQHSKEQLWHVTDHTESWHKCGSKYFSLLHFF